VQLPAAPLTTALNGSAEGYHLKLTSPVLARSVYVTFGDASAEVSDNYFDLLPNETVELVVKSKAPLDALKTNLRVISLADAFLTQNTSK
jgi:beta-mannosidase